MVAFGIKHVARELAEKAGVPIVPGTKGLVTSEEDALKESEKLGYPVMLKATAGGGGMGLVVCDKADDVKEGFRMVQSRGKAVATGTESYSDNLQARHCSRAATFSSKSIILQAIISKCKYSETDKVTLFILVSENALFSAEIRK